MEIEQTIQTDTSTDIDAIDPIGVQSVQNENHEFSDKASQSPPLGTNARKRLKRKERWETLKKKKKEEKVQKKLESSGNNEEKPGEYACANF